MQCCDWTFIKRKNWSIRKKNYFFCGSNEKYCKVEVTEERVDLGDGEGLQISYKLHFTGDSK